MKNIRLKVIMSASLILMVLLNVEAQSGEDLNASFVNFTPQFFICIIAGVLLAMGFQVVLTILSVASGVSLMGNLEKTSGSSNEAKQNKVAESDSKSEKPSTPLLVKITSGAGIWTILTASISLFCASLLAVKLSLISNNAVGITLGLVIWAAFFMIMMYLEIKSVSTLVGGIFNTALHGIRYSFSTIQKVFSSSPEERIAKVAHNTVMDIGKELSAAIDNSKISKKIDKYVKDLKPKEMDFSKMREEVVKLFKEVEIEERIERGGVALDQNRLIRIAESQKGFNKGDALKVAQVLVEAWGMYKLAAPISETVVSSIIKFTSNGNGKDEPGIKEKIESYLRETGKDELRPEILRKDFERVLSEPKLTREIFSEKLQAVDRTAVLTVFAKRADITQDEANMIADTVLTAYNDVKDKIRATGESPEMEGPEESKKQKFMMKVEDKVRNYLASKENSNLDYDQIKGDFITIFHNPKATYTALKTQLSQYDKESLIAMLSTKENITSEESEKLVNKIEEAKQYVLGKIEKVEGEAKSRLDQAKSIALHEAEIVRKTAATAAWWMFATAIVSGVAAALGGYLAIS